MSTHLHPNRPTEKTYLRLGWNPDLETFFAFVMHENKEGPVWQIGLEWGEIRTVRALFKRILSFIPQFQPMNFQELLEEDQKEKPYLQKPPYMALFDDWFGNNKAAAKEFCAWCGELSEKCAEKDEHTFYKGDDYVW